jgi:hypothetical protein
MLVGLRHGKDDAELPPAGLEGDGVQVSALAEKNIGGAKV